MNKINIVDIVRDHFATLKDERTRKLSLLDLFIFFGLGVIAAVISYAKCLLLEENTISVMITALSIFAGLLINVLILIYTVSQRPQASGDQIETQRAELERRFLREIFANLSFAILMAVLCVILLVAVIFFTGNVAAVLSALVAMLIVDFLLTLLMSLKRIHILLTNRFADAT